MCNIAVNSQYPFFQWVLPSGDSKLFLLRKCVMCLRLPAFVCNQRQPTHKKERKKKVIISENANPTSPLLHHISRGHWPGAIETQFFFFPPFFLCRCLERKFLGSFLKTFFTCRGDYHVRDWIRNLWLFTVWGLCRVVQSVGGHANGKGRRDFFFLRLLWLLFNSYMDHLKTYINWKKRKEGGEATGWCPVCVYTMHKNPF